MQEYGKTLLRSSPLQRPTGPLQPCLRALFVSAHSAACVSPATARASPLSDRRASFALCQPRVAVPEIGCTEQDYSSDLVGPRDGQSFENVFHG